MGIVFSSCRSKDKPLFQQLPGTSTGISFINEVHDSDSLSILDYLYFYNGGGVAVGDINNDGLQDIFFTANKKGGNKFYLNRGNFKFQDITTSAGVAGISDWCSGVTMTDVNGDGLLDIYVCAVSGKLHLEGHNELYINNGNNTFTERSSEYGLNFSGFSTQAAFFDYDRDGDLDCYLLNQSDHSVEVYRDTAQRRKVSDKAGDKLYRNNGGHFTDVTTEVGIYSSGLGYGLGLAIGDLNSDGWDDIYVGNDFHENDYYYINKGDGTFSESGASAFAHYSRFSMGNDIADYNNDGYLDVMTVDMLPEDERMLKTYGGEEALDVYRYKITANGFQNQYSRNCLQLNVANGSRFSDVGLQAGVAATDWSWSPLLADFDNDGIKDLFISNGIQKRMLDLDYVKFVSSPHVQRQLTRSHLFDQEVMQKIPDGKWHDYLYRGTESGRFEDRSQDWGFNMPTLSNGAAYADLDNDGDLDLVINRVNEEAGVYRNNFKGKNYLQLSFQGEATNRLGIGTKVYLFTQKGIQMQELMLTRGFQSSVPAVLHFGLDSLATVDSIVIVWGGNRSQILRGVQANQRMIVKQRDAKDSFQFECLFQPAGPMLREITAQTGLTWKHQENVFFDFNRQGLIPRMLSSEGPKMAVGDVNGDGLDDVFVCGAKGQASALFVQNGQGRFEQVNGEAFKADAAHEDVDAVFFDADNDRDLDLYVVCGGNEYNPGDSLLQDRLYVNNGKGAFTKVNHALPKILENKSCARAADLNNDGFSDLFVGGRSDASSYGRSPKSYVLLNNGRGQFTEASSQWLGPLQSLGMVTSAVFNDFTGDGKVDLVVVGDWMPVTFLENKGGRFADKTALVASPQLNSLWYFIDAADIDGDGDSDFVLGNYGTNSKLQASGRYPLRLYLADLDANGNPDQLLCVNKNGKYYAFLNKEELEKQLPFIKKKYLEYASMAGKPIEEIIDAKELANAQLLEAYNLQSGVLRNNGNGKFNWEALPAAAQVAPVFSILPVDLTGDGHKDLLGGGNFYGVLPYEGCYDASNLWVAQCHSNPLTALWPNQSGFFLPGEVRDIKMARSINQSRLIVVARNNDSIRVFR